MTPRSSVTCFFMEVAMCVSLSGVELRCVCVCGICSSASIFVVCVCVCDRRCAFKREGLVCVCVCGYFRGGGSVGGGPGMKSTALQREYCDRVWVRKKVGTDRQVERQPGGLLSALRGQRVKEEWVCSASGNFKRKFEERGRCPNSGSVSDKPCPCPCVTQVSGCQRSRTMCKPMRTSERSIKVTTPPVALLQWLSVYALG